ncbi:hypothetical protein [Dankookia sp. P2]|uniref:hypothetical protein n=1 Tax=Dankookia sp. P2 TaxID=3423955 RepID=UPI003D67991F
MTMIRALGFVLLLTMAGAALAQQQAPGLPAGSPEVQSSAPEVGAGRGGANNSQQPATSEQQPATGQPRSAAPEGIAPRPAVPVAPVVAPPPFTARGGPDAAEVEREMARQLGAVRGIGQHPEPVGRHPGPAGRARLAVLAHHGADHRRRGHRARHRRPAGRAFPLEGADADQCRPVRPQHRPL